MSFLRFLDIFNNVVFSLLRKHSFEWVVFEIALVFSRRLKNKATYLLTMASTGTGTVQVVVCENLFDPYGVYLFWTF